MGIVLFRIQRNHWMVDELVLVVVCHLDLLILEVDGEVGDGVLEEVLEYWALGALPHWLEQSRSRFDALFLLL